MNTLLHLPNHTFTLSIASSQVPKSVVSIKFSSVVFSHPVQNKWKLGKSTGLLS